jgi:hypothetical protein
MENTEWVYDVAAGTWRAAEMVHEAKKEMKKMTVNQIDENSLRMFNKFLKSL